MQPPRKSQGPPHRHPPPTAGLQPRLPATQGGGGTFPRTRHKGGTVKAQSSWNTKPLGCPGKVLRPRDIAELRFQSPRRAVLSQPSPVPVTDALSPFLSCLLQALHFRRRHRLAFPPPQKPSQSPSAPSARRGQGSDTGWRDWGLLGPTSTPTALSPDAPPHAHHRCHSPQQRRAPGTQRPCAGEGQCRRGGPAPSSRRQSPRAVLGLSACGGARWPRQDARSGRLGPGCDV